MKVFDYFEVEDRPVVVDRSDGVAWVWSGGTWKDAPGLVGKSYADGIRMTREEFAAEFPFAPLDQIEMPIGQ